LPPLGRGFPGLQDLVQGELKMARLIAAALVAAVVLSATANAADSTRPTGKLPAPPLTTSWKKGSYGMKSQIPLPTGQIKLPPGSGNGGVGSGVAKTAAPTGPQTMRGGPSTGSNSASFTPQWADLKTGAGGQITSLQVDPTDNTTVAATDAYGAYLYNATGTCVWGATTFSPPCWQQLVTVTSLGQTQTATLNLITALNMGVIEIVTCHSNTNVAYMMSGGFLWVTTNLKSGSPAGSHVTWKQTTLTTKISGNNNQSKGRGKYIKCDPNNADVALITTDAGAFYTLNGTSGTPTFNAVPGKWTPGTCSGSTCPDVVEYDPASSTGTCTGSVKCSQHLWIGKYGTGIYESTTGPQGTFTLTTGTQTTYYHMYADKFSQLWLTTGNSNVYRYLNGSGWTTLAAYSSDTAYNVSIDPNSSSSGTNHIVLTTNGGQPNVSTNNGASWSGATSNETVSVGASQPGWLANANLGTGSGTAQIFLSALDIAFDTSSNLWVASGVGMWQTAAPVQFNNTVWAANTLGVEELVPVGVISPPGSSPAVSVWDRGFMLNQNPDVYPPAQFFHTLTDNPISDGWAIDYATSSPFTFAGWQGRSNNNGGSSSDGGNTWTRFSTFPSPDNIGGNIAASTSTNWILFAGDSGSQALNYTTNAGGTWTPVTISGTPQFVSTPGVRFSLAADRVNANTFCAMDRNENLYSSTNSGQNWTLRLTSSAFDGGTNADLLAAMPGQAGTFFWSSGSTSGSHPANTHLWKITSNANQCDKATNVNAGLKEVWAVGFGAPKPGTSPATIYVYGWLSGTLGFYQSNDIGSTWTAIQVPSSQSTFPMGSLGNTYGFSGDSNVYGRIYIGMGGNGFAYIDTQDACPWVNFSNTLPNASLAGTVTLTAQQSGLVPVTNVNFYVDGILIGTQTSGTGTPTTYSQSWNTGGVATGAHTLKVLATGNNAGCTTSLSSGNSFSIPITTH
jgi:xyloglucan-specific exo-beta-1,4-glucanase